MPKMKVHDGTKWVVMDAGDADTVGGISPSEFEQTTNKGKNSGYAGLDATGKVPIDNIPNIPWANLNDKPTSIVTDIDDAVAKKHSHSNQAILDDIQEPYTTAEKSKLAGIEAGAQVNTVTSVNAKTGAVALTYTDVGALGASQTAVNSQKIGGHKLTVGTVAPTTPEANDIWIDMN